MGKLFFKIRHNDKIHSCCFDEERRIFVLDENGNIVAESGPLPVYSVEMAKERAAELVVSLKTKQQQQ